MEKGVRGAKVGSTETVITDVAIVPQVTFIISHKYHAQTLIKLLKVSVAPCVYNWKMLLFFYLLDTKQGFHQYFQQERMNLFF